MNDFVTYDEKQADDGIVSSLLEIGFEEDDADWLGGLIGHPGFFKPDPESGNTDYEKQKERHTPECLDAVRQVWDRHHADRNILLVRAVQVVMDLDPEIKLQCTDPWSSDGLLLDTSEKGAEFMRLKPSWAEKLRALDINWTEALRAALHSGVRITHKLAAVLLVAKLRNFDWTTVLDGRRLLRDHAIDEELLNLHRDDQKREDLFDDPTRLEFWLAVFTELFLNQEAFKQGIGQLRSLSVHRGEERRDDLLNSVIWSCLAFVGWAWSGNHKNTESNPTAPEFGDAVLSTVLEVLEEECSELLFRQTDRSEAAYAWMTLRHRNGRGEDGIFTEATLLFTTSETYKIRLLDVAHEVLGKVRNALRDDDPERSKLEYTRHHLHIAVDIVDKLSDNPWRATKATLLALRELRFPAVGDDLRYWYEHPKNDPPDTWWEIPHLIAEQFRFHRRITPSEDRMDDVREKFARFCLERLKTKKSENGRAELVEPDPVWRRGYVLALKELGSNPGGKGHHVLHWLTENDPDDDVRREAKATYKKLRQNEGLPARTSPLTALFAAFWWLRQAHVIHLGGTVDQASASRTRAKEVRRTN